MTITCPKCSKVTYTVVLTQQDLMDSYLGVKPQKSINIHIQAYHQALFKHPEWPDDVVHCAAIVAEEAEEAGELVRAALQGSY